MMAIVVTIDLKLVKQKANCKLFLVVSRGGLQRLQPRQRSKTTESLRLKTTSPELKSSRWTGRKKRERRTKVSIWYYWVHMTGVQWLK